ncbi:cAMP-regulated phosphoprotein 19 [Octopus sinensis]|uniref:cAMP-regulated phosphoprotein 19 n=1 Tax=Octopus sinensis TaxID=2607531 RepID=A0A6P7SZG0_9MOLL|nr:cAMP-regulated phosphoprotein 19 [Octopus sinensis]
MSSETGGTAVSSAAAGMSRVESSSTVREDNTNNTSSVDSTGPHADTQKQPQGKNVIEHQEEAKLKAKYPNLQIKGGGSALLQKRLQRGFQYFDSGDYNMAKAKQNNPSAPLPALEKRYFQDSFGEPIPKPPKPENLPPKKPHCQTSKLASDTAATASSPSPL